MQITIEYTPLCRIFLLPMKLPNFRIRYIPSEYTSCEHPKQTNPIQTPKPSPKKIKQIFPLALLSPRFPHFFPKPPKKAKTPSHNCKTLQKKPSLQYTLAGWYKTECPIEFTVAVCFKIFVRRFLHLYKVSKTLYGPLYKCIWLQKGFFRKIEK